MLNTEQKNTFKMAIDHFGYFKQVIKTIEELSELQKELCKNLNSKDVADNLINMAEEIADCKIMIFQTIEIFKKVNPNFEVDIEKYIELKNLKMINLLKTLKK